MAITHKDIDNRRLHTIANRISLYGEVYDTTFVSNRAARVADYRKGGQGGEEASESKSQFYERANEAAGTKDLLRLA